MSAQPILQLPPLFTPDPVVGQTDPLERARALAIVGSDPGTVSYKIGPERLQAALTLAPEVPLEDAMAMLPACGVGFQNALGALAPPEVAVHLEWTGNIQVNAARCGALRICASTQDPTAEPDWLIISLQVELSRPADEDHIDPHLTTLQDEGCVEVEPGALIESWVRHTLFWINRWNDEGTQGLLAEWRGLADGIGKEITLGGKTGVFVGVDERFGALVRDDDTTHCVPLSQLLEA